MGFSWVAASLFPESLFCLTSGRKMHTPEMIVPRALVFRPLVKGNEDSGNKIGVAAVIIYPMKLIGSQIPWTIKIP